MIDRKHYEDKYDVEAELDIETGETRFKERQKDEVRKTYRSKYPDISSNFSCKIDEEMDKIKAKKLAKKGIIVKSKEEKRKLKRLKEKEKKLKKKRRLRKQLMNADGEWEVDEDKVRDFDDVKDKVAFNEVVQEPPRISGTNHGQTKRKSLILNKKMSLAKKQILESEREKAIADYRMVKRQRLNKVKL